MIESHKYAAHIRKKGFRMTPQRQIVLEAIAACEGHASAGDIYEWVAARAPAVNRATVYRVLNFLCEVRLAARFDAGTTTLFELVGSQPHHHLVCRQCGRVDPVPDHTLDVLVRALQQEHGFAAELQHLAITGLCHHCLQA